MVEVHRWKALRLEPSRQGMLDELLGKAHSLPGGLLAVVVAAVDAGLRSWTVAMMRRTLLICRLPARESRWRTWSPEESPSMTRSAPG